MDTKTATLPPEELWSVEQLAEYLGTGKRFVYRLTSEGRIRFNRIGKSLRFDPADVAEFLEREKCGPPSAPAAGAAASSGSRGRPRAR